MWYVVWADVDKSHSIVDEESLICITRVDVNELVTFFYNNKPFLGIVTHACNTWEEANDILKGLGMQAARDCRPSVSSSSTPSCLGKRPQVSPDHIVMPPKRGNKPVTKSVKPTKEDIMRERKEREKKKSAEALANKAILAEVKEKEMDPDFQVDEEPPAEHDYESDASSLTDLVNANKQRQTQRRALVNDMRNGSKVQNGGSSTSCTPASSQHSSKKSNEVQPPAVGDKRSPEELMKENEMLRGEKLSAEELKKENEMLRIKLQMAYDGPSPAAGNDDNGDGESMYGFGRKGTLDGSTSEKEQGNDNGAMDPFNEKTDKSGEDSLDLDDLEDHLSPSNLDHQLIGQHDKSVLLGNDIHCNREVWKTAFNRSGNVGHYVRRLMEGVFKSDIFLLYNVTYSGQTYRHLKVDNENCQQLHPKAIKTIVDYANKVGERKLWPKKKLRELGHIISHKVGEMKRKAKKSKK